ncbi:MAG: galactoside ABC transporter permease [Sphaerochaetaceae bacterium]|nr:galactoside ABC transporter permease [Sphaerochaetaceae bacterium]
MTKETKDILSLDEDRRIAEYTKRLNGLRSTGVNRITELRQEIVTLRKSKMVDPLTKKKTISDLQQQIGFAKRDAEEHKAEIDALTKEAVAYANTASDAYIKKVTTLENEAIKAAKAEYQVEAEKIRLEGVEQEKKIVASYEGKTSKEERKELREEIDTCRYEMKSALFDAKSRCQTLIDRSLAAKNQAFVDHVQTNRSLRNGKTKFSENMELKFKNYIFNFKLSKFLLNNGLYIAILIFFIVCIILAPLSGSGNLLSLPNILTILEQASTRMFFALGVAGLILLAGTDLSVGRMVALGAVTTGLILHPGMNIVTVFGMGPWNFTPIPMLVRVLMALVISIVLCVVFSSFAGVFTARLKIHPFISTLATQLIIYGLLFFGTSGTPVGSIDSSIKDMLGGRWILGMVNGQLITFPKLIIPAVIAIIVAWFIWNKTTFGKNMYAVGGNAEAASVSGISVFKVTMGVFIMAGIFYGCGAFLEAFRANASAGTGQGYELDAIAACVVGGISFNGGIGKIGGAVIGVIIFTGLTYCLTFLGIDTNLQFVFKGFIIIAAVALDSVKYLKKK